MDEDTKKLVKVAFDAKVKNCKCQQVIDHFGLTEDLFEAGYILPSGALIDLSGKNEGGTPHMRSFDHRDVSRFMDGSSGEGMIEYMKDCKAIRYSFHRDKSCNISVHEDNKPTLEQLKKMALSLGLSEHWFISCTLDDKNGEDTCCWERDCSKLPCVPMQIQKYIKKCWGGK